MRIDMPVGNDRRELGIGVNARERVLRALGDRLGLGPTRPQDGRDDGPRVRSFTGGNVEP
jgi:hypothetical protein